MIFLLQREGRGKGAAAPFPCTPNPRRTSSASLRTISPGPPRLTKPNTSCTIISPASLRSDCCSPSLRNAVRLPSGIDVHLYRNTQLAGSMASYASRTSLVQELFVRTADENYMAARWCAVNRLNSDFLWLG